MFPPPPALNNISSPSNTTFKTTDKFMSQSSTTFFMKLNVYSSQRVLTVTFPFDLANDTPEQIVKEMRSGLNLNTAKEDDGHEMRAL